MGLSEEFLEGNRRRYTATFKVPDDAGELTDPSTVKFFRRQIGTGSLDDLETYEFGVDNDVTKDSTGVYELELSYPTDGRYVVGVEGTGTCEAYTEIDIVVTNARARA